MPMFQIDMLDRTPIYEQLKRQIMTYISLGVLEPDEKMPSVRSLASQLGINPNTVHKVYRDLEMTEVLYTLPARGTYVKKPLEPDKEDYGKWTESCNEILQEAVARSLDLERCREIFNQEIENIKAEAGDKQRKGQEKKAPKKDE